MEINGRRAYKLPDKNVCCFYEVPVKNEFASAKSGAPVYDRALMVEIFSPGYKTQVHRTQVQITDAAGITRQRNSGYRDNEGAREVTWREYLGEALALYEKGITDSGGGTPLETWTKLDVAMVASLKEIGVISLEMLSDVPDSRLHLLGMNGRTLRDQAKAWLESAAGNAQNDRLIAENNEMKARMERMEKTIAALEAATPKSDKPDETEIRRGPGRPRKEAAEAA